MASKHLAVALCVIAAAAPASAAIQEPHRGAPPGTPETRYCMRTAVITGSIIEKVRCWTREEWEDQGVDLDKEWAREGVGVRDGTTRT
jgi:hypothetical protein